MSVADEIDGVDRAVDEQSARAGVGAVVPEDELARAAGELAVVGEIEQGCRAGLVDDGAGGGGNAPQHGVAGKSEGSGTGKESAGDGCAIERDSFILQNRKVSVVERELARGRCRARVSQPAQRVDGDRRADRAQAAVEIDQKASLLHRRSTAVVTRARIGQKQVASAGFEQRAIKAAIEDSAGNGEGVTGSDVDAWRAGAGRRAEAE